TTLRNGTGDYIQRVFGCFHHIVPTRAVDVDVYEAGRGGQRGGVVLPRRGRNAQGVARADCRNFAVFDQDYGVGNFFVRSEGAAGEDGIDWHRRHHRTVLRLYDEEFAEKLSSKMPP